jgi:cell shape-determining protein MreD
MALSTLNILIYSAQILVLISAAAIGAAIFRLPLARARLAYWRVVVVACLVLPWVSAMVSVPPARSRRRRFEARHRAVD